MFEIILGRLAPTKYFNTKKESPFYLGFHYGNLFHYYDEELKEIKHCEIKNLRQKQFLEDEKFADFAPTLKEDYITRLENFLKKRKAPNWFRCRFVHLKIEEEYHLEMVNGNITRTATYSEKFGVLARNSLYFLNSSGERESLKFEKRTMCILEDFEEDEIPNGLEYMHNLLIEIHRELDLEWQDYSYAQQRLQFLQSSLSCEEQELLKVFRSLQPTHRSQILEYARYTADREGVLKNVTGR